MKNPITNSQREYLSTTRLILAFAVIASITTLFTSSARASNVGTVLYDFTGGSDGLQPTDSLIRDATGNLYGADISAVYELTPQGGGWVEKTLHQFTGVGGSYPSGPVMDGSGNLYGITRAGGTHSGGIVYRLSPGPNGNWTETVLWNFTTNGYSPHGGLTLDAAGNLYGVTTLGGISGGACAYHGCGVAFRLSPVKSGHWKYSVLYAFRGFDHQDGQTPFGSLTFDQVGNLYGTTRYGGVNGDGTVFELSLGAGGWTESVLHHFGNSQPDGAFPVAGVIFDDAGNLYGTTPSGGINTPICTSGSGCGSVFELSPTPGGGWTELIVYLFTGNGDGSSPLAPVTFSAGNLYGTAADGGNGKGTRGNGVVFELSPSGGTWTENILYTFSGKPDGSYPSSGVLDVAGSLYGTTKFGGANDDGLVYQIPH